jgi:hypothetical protein
LAEAQKMADAASSTGFDPNNPDDLERMGMDVNKYIGAVAELANILPSTFPARNRYLMDVFFQILKK